MRFSTPLCRMVFERVGRHVGVPMREAEQGGTVTPPVTPPASGDWGTATWAPTLPRQSVDLTAPAVTGSTWDCATGAEFQAALDGAARGDRITLHAGVTYTPTSVNGFRIPPKDGTGWLTITLRDSDIVNLPTLQSDGTCDVATASARVGYSHWAAGQLATIQTYHGATGTQTGIGLYAAAGSSYIYIRGLAVVVNPTFTGINQRAQLCLTAYGAVGSDSVSGFDLIPHHITVQQCFAQNPITNDVKRAVEMHCDYGGIANSTIIGRSTQGNDIQGLWTAVCRGPLRFYNSAFIAPGENWFCGGVDLPGWMAPEQPADITCEYCWFYTPPEWLRGHPSYAGTFQNCKNSQEFKSGKYVLIDRCIWEGSTNNNATMGQNGQTLTIKVLTENFYSNPKANASDPPDATHGGQMYWVECGHITVRRSHSFAAGSGFDIFGVQNTIYSGGGVQTHDVLVEDCLQEILRDGTVTGVSRYFNMGATTSNWGTGGRFLVRHNTQVGAAVSICTSSKIDPLMVEHNLRSYGYNNYVGGIAAWQASVNAAGNAPGSDHFTFGGAGITAYCPGTHHNAWIGDKASRYAGYAVSDGGLNWMDGSDASYGLNADGSLAADSILKAAGSDGADIGSRVDVLTEVTGVRTPDILPSWP